MRKQIAQGLLVLAASTLASQALAGEWEMLPFKNAGWSPDFTLALTTGPMDPDVDGVDSDTASGVQLSLNCPWFSPPEGTIRQQFNYNTFDDGNVEIKSFELNPHWYVGDEALQYGFGPGLGYVWATPKGLDEQGMWSVQLSADIEYRSGAFFVGAGTRYQVTQSKDFGAGTKDDANNLLTQIKVGMNF